MQRLRIRFSRGKEIKFISHLDLMRLWQRAFHRAGIPLAYSEGFSPHPRISLAAPLALGITSGGELMDIVCSKQISPHWLTSAVSQQLPQGIEILQVQPVAPTLPALQAQVRFTEYRVEVETEQDQKGIESAIDRLLALTHLQWHHRRDTGERSYDLRALVDDLWLIDWHPPLVALGMRLRCDSSGSGRPEQVVSALGFSRYPQSIHRTRLILGVEENIGKNHTGQTRRN